MSKKAVLITGGARRLGAELALHFAKQGYDVALHYNRSKKEAQRTQKQIVKMGRRCELFAQDLAQIKAIPALMAKVKKSMPYCGVLINNASVFERVEFMKTNEALFDRQLTVNFKAPFFLTQGFAKAVGGGSVVNILDTDIAQVQTTHFAYLLSKKALGEFTKMAARELGPKIRVNAVCPGYVIPQDAADAKYIRKIEKNLPLQSQPHIEDITEAVYWLSSQKRVTGEIMFVDGGKHVL